MLDAEYKGLVRTLRAIRDHEHPAVGDDVKSAATMTLIGLSHDGLIKQLLDGTPINEHGSD